MKLPMKPDTDDRRTCEQCAAIARPCLLSRSPGWRRVCCGRASAGVVERVAAV
jgi:hypothetical protein